MPPSPRRCSIIQAPSILGLKTAGVDRLPERWPLPPELLAIDHSAVRRMGLEHATRAALERVTRPELEGFFIHVDADSLHDDIMPAVDYRMPDGFSASELTSVLQAALATGRAVGLEVTIYNPTLDPDGSAGRALAGILAAALAPSSK